MNIEQQVVSLELAKQLKDAGYPQEGLWWWVYTTVEYPKKHWEFVVSMEPRTFSEYKDIYVAPTVAELGKILRDDCFSYRTREQIWYCYGKIGSGMYSQEADTEADARAKMLLYLHKEGLIKW